MAKDKNKVAPAATSTTAAAEPAKEAETKAIISSHPNGFVHQGELLALLQNFEDRITKLEGGDSEDDGTGDPA